MITLRHLIIDEDEVVAELQNNELTRRVCCSCSSLQSSALRQQLSFTCFATDIEWNTSVRCTEAYWVNCWNNAAVRSGSWLATDVIPTCPARLSLYDPANIHCSNPPVCIPFHFSRLSTAPTLSFCIVMIWNCRFCGFAGKRQCCLPRGRDNETQCESFRSLLIGNHVFEIFRPPPFPHHHHQHPPTPDENSDNSDNSEQQPQQSQELHNTFKGWHCVLVDLRLNL